MPDENKITSIKTIQKAVRCPCCDEWLMLESLIVESDFDTFTEKVSIVLTKVKEREIEFKINK